MVRGVFITVYLKEHSRLTLTNRQQWTSGRSPFYDRTFLRRQSLCPLVIAHAVRKL